MKTRFVNFGSVVNFFSFCLSQLPIVDERECKRNLEENGVNFSRGVICAGTSGTTGTSGKGTCHVSNSSDIVGVQLFQGDSGGALMVGGVLAGIVSRGGTDECVKVRLKTIEFVK